MTSFNLRVIGRVESPLTELDVKPPLDDDPPYRLL